MAHFRLLLLLVALLNSNLYAETLKDFFDKVGEKFGVELSLQMEDPFQSKELQVAHDLLTELELEFGDRELVDSDSLLTMNFKVKDKSSLRLPTQDANGASELDEKLLIKMVEFIRQLGQTPMGESPFDSQENPFGPEETKIELNQTIKTQIITPLFGDLSAQSLAYGQFNNSEIRAYFIDKKLDPQPDKDSIAPTLFETLLFKSVLEHLSTRFKNKKVVTFGFQATLKIKNEEDKEEVHIYDQGLILIDLETREVMANLVAASF